MLCSNCGGKVQFKRSALVCKTCDFEFDVFDFDDELIPEPIFVAVQLHSQYAIIDTRRQTVYLCVDTNEKAQLLSQLLNKNLAEIALSKKMGKYIEG